MKRDDKTNSNGSQNDDVGRLFDKLGSAGAGLYQDFEPNRLPSARTGVQGVPVTVAEPAVPQPPPLASVRALRPEPVAAVIATAPTAPNPTAAQSPLGELFNRLLQAETAPPSSGVLKRMFAR